MIQTRKMTVIESIFNTVVGFGISVLVYAIVLPLFGFETTMTQNVILVAAFSVISIARNYVVRRFFIWVDAIYALQKREC